MRSPWVVLLFSSALAAESGGQFFRVHWFEPGVEHGNPVSNRRFRVNSPEAVLDPSYGRRSEVKSSGMLQIHMEEDLFQLDAAELYLELWGGHPGTANKRVTLNGRTTYEIPEAGTAAMHCTHQYPTIPLQLTDLVNGYNAVQFAADRGKSFWGHFIVDNAALRAALKPGHPDLRAAGLQACRYSVRAQPAGEHFALSIDAAPACLAVVERASYQAAYSGYNENGMTDARGWHGFTYQRQPHAWAASSSNSPFDASWDTSMLPAQSGLAIRAMLTFRGHPNLIYITAPLESLATSPRSSEVRLYAPRTIPAPFWSRAGRKITTTIDIPAAVSRIQRAELHTVVWDGGAGAVKDYFTLNGQALSIAGDGKHNVIYRITPLDPSMLRTGSNQIELLSDTEHHGIEMLRPGPAIVLRLKP